MSKQKIQKTNVMRILESNNIHYKAHYYENNGEAVDGITVSKKLSISCNKIFKTLVTVSSTKEYVIGVVGVDKHLDLKKLANVSGFKKLDMLNMKDLLKITGYVRGGCSPFGMKKQFITIIDKNALNEDSILVSAGNIGEQVEITPNTFKELLNAKFEDIIQS